MSDSPCLPCCIVQPLQPVLYNVETGDTEWEPGPMRTLTVPKRSGGGTLTLFCRWGDLNMEVRGVGAGRLGCSCDASCARLSVSCWDAPG